jgi:hypothetical protein
MGMERGGGSVYAALVIGIKARLIKTKNSKIAPAFFIELFFFIGLPGFIFYEGI